MAVHFILQLLPNIFTTANGFPTKIVRDWRTAAGLPNMTIYSAPNHPTVAFYCGYSYYPTDSWRFVVLDTNGFEGMPWVPYEAEVNVSQWYFPEFETFYNETSDLPNVKKLYNTFRDHDCDVNIIRKNHAAAPPQAPFRVPGIGGECGSDEAYDMYYSFWFYYNSPYQPSNIKIDMYDSNFDTNWFAQTDDYQWYEYVATRYVYYPKYLNRESDEDIAFKLECDIWTEPVFPPHLTMLSRCNDAYETVDDYLVCEHNSAMRHMIKTMTLSVLMCLWMVTILN